MIALRFICGERKICLTIKKPQNIMKMVVVKKNFKNSDTNEHFNGYWYCQFFSKVFEGWEKDFSKVNIVDLQLLNYSIIC